MVDLFALTASGIVIGWGWPPNLGIDLSGGLVMVYQVDMAAKPADVPINKDNMNKLIDAVKKRVNPSNLKETKVVQYSTQQIEITIPNVADKNESNQIKDSISRMGALEFRILANKLNHDDYRNRMAIEGATPIRALRRSRTPRGT